ncbi:hypothetical protein T440DRAFT_538633 [Plenodomus tracheiphilus IPT5]|uniref:Uncharacterized protein n=1 Tax=Plenodomus tracheiphilus IPT5 TaxID=1408161 RepID=A0A6A7AW63_9PLEO|nr:hypothetical protein T440DRAFT_538633 [Plenodomus tracheiphilus IPT5]
MGTRVRDRNSGTAAVEMDGVAARKLTVAPDALLALDSENKLQVRQADITGAAPDETYPPIPTSTSLTTTVFETVRVTAGHVPNTSTISGSPSTPASTSPAIPSSFCLKVVTPNVLSTDWLVKQSSLGSNGAFPLDPTDGGNGTVARFYLDANNRIKINVPGLSNVKAIGYSLGTGALIRWNDDYTGFNPIICSICTTTAAYRSQQILQCTGGSIDQPVRTFTGSRYDEYLGIVRLDGSTDLEVQYSTIPTNFIVDLGLFTG